MCACVFMCAVYVHDECKCFVLLGVPACASTYLYLCWSTCVKHVCICVHLCVYMCSVCECVLCTCVVCICVCAQAYMYVGMQVCMYFVLVQIGLDWIGWMGKKYIHVREHRTLTLTFPTLWGDSRAVQLGNLVTVMQKNHGCIYVCTEQCVYVCTGMSTYMFISVFCVRKCGRRCLGACV